jgi:hypothetical protein
MVRLHQRPRPVDYVSIISHWPGRHLVPRKLNLRKILPRLDPAARACWQSVAPEM